MILELDQSLVRSLRGPRYALGTSHQGLMRPIKYCANRQSATVAFRPLPSASIRGNAKPWHHSLVATLASRKAPKRDGSHGSPCLGQAISTSMKKGRCHEKDSCNSGTGLRTHHRHDTDNGLWVWPFPTAFKCRLLHRQGRHWATSASCSPSPLPFSWADCGLTCRRL